MRITSRRWFLSGCVAAAGILPALSRRLSFSRPDVKFPSEPKARIAVSSYPFRAFIPGEEHQSGHPTVELKDFAAHVAQKFGVHRGIDRMFAHAYGIRHVKDSEVDDRCKPVHVDLVRTFGTLKAHGYRGYCSIEYDSPGDPYPATPELVDETVRFLS